MVSQYEGKRPPSLDIFLKFIGLTEQEFEEIAMEHNVSPWQFESSPSNLGEKLADYDQWSQEGTMDREEAVEMMELWRNMNAGND